MSITSVVNDNIGDSSFINAQKPIPPTISNYVVSGTDDAALLPAGGQTVLINGTGFLRGATVSLSGTAIGVVTWVSANQLSFTSPASAAGTYTLYVVNSDGGTAIYIPGLIYSTNPTWTTAAGSLGSYYETQAISNTVVATDDTGSAMTYAVTSGSLPSGATLYANGLISGTAPVDSGSTTYSFTIDATDTTLQSTSRSFSLTINTDVVTWVNPSNGATIILDGTAYSNVLVATDAAGYSIASYAANALPTGLTLSGNTISGTPTTSGSTTTLLTATAATTNRSATNTITWVVSLSDIYWNYVTLLLSPTLAALPFNYDASTNNFNITVNGNTRPSNYSPYEPGYYSNFFDGTGDYLTLASSSAFNISGNFTIEGWYSFTALPGAGTNDNLWTFSGVATYNPYMYLWGDGTIILRTEQTGGTVFTITHNFVLNRWYHIAVVKSGTTFTLYINGTSAGTGTSSAIVSQNKSLEIGGQSTFGFAGYLSNFRVVNGTAVYTANFTPSTTPLTAISGTSLLTCADNRFIDNSTNNFTITVNGNITVNPFVPFVPSNSYATYGSGYFDGTATSTAPLVISTASGQLNLPGDFTIELWFYDMGTSKVLQQFAYQSFGGFGCGINAFDGNATRKLDFRQNGGAPVYGVTAITPNVWNHAAFVRSGTAFRIFLNGVLDYYNANYTTSFTSSSTNIGSAANGDTGYSFLGYISNFRIVKGTAVYTTSSTTIGAQIFTPPTSPLTAIANTSLLTLQTNQPTNNSMFLDSGTFAFPITRAGNTTQGSFTPNSPGSWSAYFNGSTDFLTLASSSTAYNFGAGVNFTVEAWVYPTSLVTIAWGIIDARVNGASNAAWLVSLVNVSGNYRLSFFNAGSNTGTTNIPLNTWTHVAVVRNGTALRTYVNGVLDLNSSSYGSGSISPGTTAPRVGSDKDASGTNYATIGYISNLRIVNGTAVYTANFTPSTTPLNAIANTSLLTLQDNRFMDDSINNFTITRNGTTRITNFSPFGALSQTAYYSNFFDGDGDYLTIPESTPLNISTGDFTIEAWVLLRAMPTTDTLSTWQNWMVIYARGTINASDGWQFQIGQTLLMFSDSYGTSVCSGTHGMVINSWYHLAVSRSGNTFRVFVNGTQVGTSTSAITLNNGVTYWIGTETGQGAYLNGYISNLRVVKGTAVYTANFTPSTTPLTAISGTQLLTCQSATFIDNSTNNFTLTVTGTPYPKIISPFTPPVTTGVTYSALTNGASGYFDGTGDYLSLPAAQSSLQPGAGNFTIEFWYNISTAPGGYINVFSYGSTGAALRLFLYTTNSFTLFAGVTLLITANNSVIINAWNHVAIVRNGTTIVLYVNGVSVGSVVNSTDYLGSLNIGFESGQTLYTGYLSDFRIVKGQALYTSSFVPPVQALTAVQNTVFLSSFGYGAIVDASCENNLETVADAKVSTAVVKYGNTSMFFDGTGDYLFVPNNVNYQFGTGNYTVEFWLNMNSFSGQNSVILDFRTGNGATGGALQLYVTSAGIVTVYGGSSTATLLVTAGSAISTATWAFIALTRSSNSTRLFINGTQSGSTATDSTSYGLGALWVGSNAGGGSNYLTGYLSDVRITNGIARYTSNFTAPTSAFQRN